MKILIVLAVIIAAGLSVYFGVHAGAKTMSPAVNHGRSSLSQHTAAAKAGVSSLSIPSPPLSCFTNASLMPYTSDYSITDMNCSPSNSPGNTVLLCNGTILNSATNVTVNCSTPGSTATENGVYCRGSASSSGGNLNLNYSCYNSNHLTSNGVYVCNGVLSGYSSLGISLPLNVSCGP